MTRIAHLTDLHFGRERAELVAPLAEALRLAAPDLVIASGDLSHRARAGQFRRAMDFLEGLALPFIAMPGNHDVPLFNVAARLMAPFGPWRRQVSPDLAPGATLGGEFGDVRIFSVNTADPARWRRGIFRAGDLARIRSGLAEAPDFAVLACHHPLIEPPGFERGETKGAAAALPVLADEGIRVVLSGHLHHWAIGVGITPETPQPILMVQTGTALCGRVGEHDHGFSILDIAPPEVTVTPWIIDEERGAFAPRAPRRFRHGADGWRG